MKQKYIKNIQESLIEKRGLPLMLYLNKLNSEELFHLWTSIHLAKQFALNTESESNHSQQIRSNSVQDDEVGVTVKEIGNHKPSLSSSVDAFKQEEVALSGDEE